MLTALSRMTITPTMINGGVKSNSVPEQINLTCDVRTLPHQDDDYLRSELDRIKEDIPGVTYEIDYMAVPNSSEFETELAEHIQAATAMALERDDIQWVPAISTGFTDSRFTRPLNVITYGFSGSHPDDDPCSPAPTAPTSPSVSQAWSAAPRSCSPWPAPSAALSRDTMGT